MEFLDDSSTESLLLSGDEYNQDFDSTNFEESQDEDDAINEIVRCICEMDEENGFMIQVLGQPLPCSSGSRGCWVGASEVFSSLLAIPHKVVYNTLLCFQLHQYWLGSLSTEWRRHGLWISLSTCRLSVNSLRPSG